MKIECEIKKIKEAISQVERIIGKNLTLPVLNSILLIAKGKTLKCFLSGIQQYRSEPVGIEVGGCCSKTFQVCSYLCLTL